VNDRLSPFFESGLSIAVTGSGGSGALTVGAVLLEAAARCGLYGLLTRSVGPQIRGGESVAMLRLAPHPVECPDNRFDLLAGLDWLNVERFLDEIPLDVRTLILADPATGTPPEALTGSGARLSEQPFRALAKEIDGGRANMVAAGIVGAVAGLSSEVLGAAVGRVLKDKGEAVIQSARASMVKGFEHALSGAEPQTPSSPPAGKRWSISGNEACGLGALRAGVRFVAAYPITPASDMLEWLAPRLEQLGGTLLQAEDELASMNMVIGASFGGVPAMTATSGPGLSLMAEGMGLAVASEIPAVVVDVTRGGPSTGLPTKTEQSDLDIALHGMHGDTPHLVLAPLSVADCAATVQWAVGLAERLQTLAVVLSDQFLGQARAITDPLPDVPTGFVRRLAAASSERYCRYHPTSGGVSPMAVPGTEACMYTGDGLEHDQCGTPSSLAGDHYTQSLKRRRKLEEFTYGPQWAQIEGSGEICLLTWGSSAGAAREAAWRLRARGLSVRLVALRLLAPLCRQELLEAIGGAQRIVVVELNGDAQCFHYLHARQALPAHAESLARPGPLPLRAGEIVAHILEGGA